eukprot:gene14762-10558_t
MVSVLEGQLSRTWYFLNQGRNHVINLYHDTITGVRSAMLDFNEIRGSTGNSSLLMDSKGHRIFFSVDSLPGYIEIKKAGWAGFTYACVINTVRIPEATEVVADDQSDVFKVKILGTTTTQDELSEHLITWYIVQTTRLADGAVTVIHRRFRDFAEFNSQVKQNFKGHHLREMLPPLPEKPLKSLTDHKDPQFIMDRQLKLETFLIAILAVPHVSHMICSKAFVGLLDRVKEYSVSFHVPQLGLSLIPYNNNANASAAARARPQDAYAQDDYNTPVVVGSVLKPDVCTGVSPGDTISKINGMPVAGTNFQGIIARIKLLPRPIIIHFISVIGGAAGSLTDDATGAATAAAAAPSSSSATSPLPKSTSGPTLEAYQEESEVSPLDQGPRTKKPDLFDAAYQNDRGDVVSFGHNASATKKAPAPTPVDNGPTQSEITAAKQAELSEASRKALEALARMDEKDDDLLFGGSSSSSSSATKRSDRSLFGSSSSGRAAVVDKDEDLFAPLVKKTPASPVPTPAAAPAPAPAPAPAAVAPAPASAPLPVPVSAPAVVQQTPVVPPSPPASPPKPVAAAPEPVVAVVEEAPAATPELSAVDQPAAIQIDPFADDFVEPVVAPVSPAPAVEPPAPTTPAQPVPLGWDD